MTPQIRSRIQCLIPTCNTLVLLLHSILTKNLTFLPGFNTIHRLYSIGVYLLWSFLTYTAFLQEDRLSLYREIRCSTNWRVSFILMLVLHNKYRPHHLTLRPATEFGRHYAGKFNWGGGKLPQHTYNAVACEPLQILTPNVWINFLYVCLTVNITSFMTSSEMEKSKRQQHHLHLAAF